MMLNPRKCLAALTAGVLCLGEAAVMGATSLVPMTASAEDQLTYGDIIYEYASDGISVCGFDSEAKNVVIPSEIDGTAVVYWEYGWGDETYPALKTLEIPGSITFIGESRFGSVSAAGDTSSMFDRFPNLKAVNVDADNEEYMSDDGVLYAKQEDGTLWMRGYPPAKSDTSYTIPDTVASINTNSLRKNLFLTDLLVTGKNTTYMSYDGVLYEQNENYDYDENGQEIITKELVYAFCPSGKTSVTIPDVITNLYGNSYFPMSSDFAGCTSLETVVIPDSVKNVDSSCFYGTKLRESQIGSVVYADTWVLNYDGEDGAEIVIKDGTVAIADYAFGWDVHSGDMWGFLEEEGITEWGPKSVVLPDSLRSIGTGAFAGCLSLEHINLPEGLEEIGEEAFASCEKLSGTLVFPGNVKQCGGTYGYAIGRGGSIFPNCTSLENVVFLQGAAEIRLGMFASCTNLKTITIPDSMTAIELGAFGDCENLKEIYYAGTEEQWNAIERTDFWSEMGMPMENDYFSAATVHFDSSAPAPAMYGDVDKNGMVDIVDVILLNRYLLVGAEVSVQGMINADVDCNGVVDPTDSLNILKHVVKLITEFPV